VSAAYVDSSCLIAVLLGEPAGVPLGHALGRYERLFASNLLDAEVCSAARRERVALLRPGAFRDLLWVLPGRSLGAEIDTALAAGYLRGADLWHVATALYLRVDIPELEFLTLDRAQGQVAAALGFPTPLRVG
jgi:predicted nucleic acid-binding protein